MNFLIALAALFAQSTAPAPPPPAGTLLVGNKGENSVSFIDLASGRELGRSATGPMPHEIAMSPDGRRAAVVSYGGASIDLFDVATRRRIATVDLGGNQGPHGIAWLRDGRIVVTTERSRSVAVVNMGGTAPNRRRPRVRTIPTGQQGTHMIAVSRDGRRAYTANIGSGTVSVIDLASGAKLRDIAVGGQPEGIDVSPDGRTLWVGDNRGARVAAFDTRSFERLAELPTGGRPIRVLASPDGRWIVTSNADDGTLTVIDARTRRVARTVPVSGAREAAQVTILFSADGRRLYAAETGRDRVAEVELASGRVLRRLVAGRQGDGLAIAPARR